MKYGVNLWTFLNMVILGLLVSAESLDLGSPSQDLTKSSKLRQRRNLVKKEVKPKNSKDPQQLHLSTASTASIASPTPQESLLKPSQPSLPVPPTEQPASAPTPLYTMNTTNPSIQYYCSKEGLEYSPMSLNIDDYHLGMAFWFEQQYFKERFKSYVGDQYATINYFNRKNLSRVYHQRFWDRYFEDSHTKMLAAGVVIFCIFAVYSLIWGCILSRIELHRPKLMEDSIFSESEDKQEEQQDRLPEPPANRLENPNRVVVHPSGQINNDTPKNIQEIKNLKNLINITEGDKIIRNSSIIGDYESCWVTLAGISVVCVIWVLFYYYGGMKKYISSSRCAHTVGIDASDYGTKTTNSSWVGISNLTGSFDSVLPYEKKFEKAFELNKQIISMNLSKQRTEMKAEYETFSKGLEKISPIYHGTQDQNIKVTSTFIKSLKIEGQLPLKEEVDLLSSDSELLEEASNILNKLKAPQLSFFNRQTDEYSRTLKNLRVQMYESFKIAMYGKQASQFDLIYTVYRVCLPILATLLTLTIIASTAIYCLRSEGLKIAKRELVFSKVHMALLFLAGGFCLSISLSMYLLANKIYFRCNVNDGLINRPKFVQEKFEVLYPGDNNKARSFARSCIYRFGNNTLEEGYLKEFSGILPILKEAFSIESKFLKELQVNWNQTEPLLGSSIDYQLKVHSNFSNIQVDRPSNQDIFSGLLSLSKSDCAQDVVKTNFCPQGYQPSSSTDVFDTDLNKKYCIQLGNLPSSTNYEGRYTQQTSHGPVTCKSGSNAQNEQSLTKLVKSSKELDQKFNTILPLFNSFYSKQEKLFIDSKSALSNIREISEIFSSGFSKLDALNETLATKADCSYLRGTMISLQNELCFKLGGSVWDVYWTSFVAACLIFFYGLCLVASFRVQVFKEGVDYNGYMAGLGIVGVSNRPNTNKERSKSQSSLLNPIRRRNSFQIHSQGALPNDNKSKMQKNMSFSRILDESIKMEDFKEDEIDIRRSMS